MAGVVSELPIAASDIWPPAWFGARLPARTVRYPASTADRFRVVRATRRASRHRRSEARDSESCSKERGESQPEACADTADRLVECAHR